jgi:hypothetical protein
MSVSDEDVWRFCRHEWKNAYGQLRRKLIEWLASCGVDATERELDLLIFARGLAHLEVRHLGQGKVMLDISPDLGWRLATSFALLCCADKPEVLEKQLCNVFSMISVKATIPEGFVVRKSEVGHAELVSREGLLAEQARIAKALER